MTSREQFENKFPVPAGVTWNSETSRYVLTELRNSTVATYEAHVERWVVWQAANEAQAAEVERLKKFEDWFVRLEDATDSIDESFRDERDLALFSTYWAARLYMVPSEVAASEDEEWIERTIRSGAETLMVGGRRLRDAAEKDEEGKPVIPFDWQYRSPREARP
ncbi:hypothetical protein [Pseudomonas abietaniphila]|uniref:hypothetical protein n=1 Tax=Pseudomonas abietaniphila TaxID=89065 RepID=UPI0007824044|nr:hypothetical protein [Pseudomonas abietaniphila]